MFGKCAVKTETCFDNSNSLFLILLILSKNSLFSPCLCVSVVNPFRKP